MAKDVKFPVKEVASMLHSVIYDYARCYDTPVKCKHWDQLSEDEKNGIIKGMQEFHDRVFHSSTSEIPSPEQVHEEWMQNKIEKGWKLGEYDPEAKTHPSLVPYAELDVREQIKDFIYIVAVIMTGVTTKAIARTMKEE